MVKEDPLNALGKKAKTARGKRVLKDRLPKIIENPKGLLLIRGNKSTNEVTSLMQDLYNIRKPLATLFGHKHPDQPFEDMAPIERRCNQLDHSLFGLGSSSKKRPFRFVLGRLFDKTLLDMQELSIKNYMPISKFSKTKMPMLGSKPLVIFQGSGFETDETLKRTKSLLMDLFGGPDPEQVLLSGLDHAIVCSTLDPGTTAAAAGKSPVFVRRYRLGFEKTGSRLPHVKLDEVGPRFDFTVDRQREPDRDRWKASMKIPKAAKTKKVKNESTNVFGERHGRIHLGKQDLDKIHTVHSGLGEKKKKKQKVESANASATD